MITQRRKLVDLRGGKGFHSCGRQIDLWFDSMLQRCIRVMQDLRVADTVREWSEWSHQQKCHSRGITSSTIDGAHDLSLREDSHGSSGSNRATTYPPEKNCFKQSEAACGNADERKHRLAVPRNPWHGLLSRVEKRLGTVKESKSRSFNAVSRRIELTFSVPRCMRPSRRNARPSMTPSSWDMIGRGLEWHVPYGIIFVIFHRYFEGWEISSVIPLINAAAHSTTRPWKKKYVPESNAGTSYVSRRARLVSISHVSISEYPHLLLRVFRVVHTFLLTRFLSFRIFGCGAKSRAREHPDIRRSTHWCTKTGQHTRKSRTLSRKDP
eukprot:GHVU01126767.1.p1 GENE.GHVU01126767.1~~GHVU01126767.1.p1  ORF type:complete len:324 (-),score=-0.47 GHVU01126767.1:76-1047(-)